MTKNPIKKEIGAIPTPQIIVEYLVNLVFKNQDFNKKEFLVLDNSVGDGRFLKQYVRTIEKNVNKSPNNSLIKFFGLDIDFNTIERANKNLEFSKRFNISLKVGNALLGYVKPPKDFESIWNEKKLNESFSNNFKIDENIIKTLAPFHWFKEWPDFSRNEGFNVIIGNPPYGVSFSQREKKTYKKLYQAVDPEIESYILFIERSIHLLKENGLLAFIVPNNIATNYQYRKIRRLLFKRVKILRIINFDQKIFPDVSVESSIILIQKYSNKDGRYNNVVRFEKISDIKSINCGTNSIKTIIQRDLMHTKYQMIVPNPNDDISSILTKIRKDSVPLNSIVSITRGIELGYHSPKTRSQREEITHVPLIAGRNIQKYGINKEIRFIEFDSNNRSIFKDKEVYLKPKKLFLRRIGHELICALDENQYFCVCDVYILVLKQERPENEIIYLEAILNSKLMSFYFKYTFSCVKKIFPKIPIKYIKELPIRIPINLKIILELSNQLHSSSCNNQSQEKSKTDYLNELEQLIFEIYDINSKEQSLINKSI